jgi:hypothetical protein
MRNNMAEKSKGAGVQFGDYLRVIHIPLLMVAGLGIIVVLVLLGIKIVTDPKAEKIEAVRLSHEFAVDAKKHLLHADVANYNSASSRLKNI